MNAFGEALNLVFMRGSGDFSSGSMPMDSISDCIPMSSSSYSLPMDSISGCIPMSSSPYSQPMNLRLHSHEFLFPANESQTAFPWVPIPQPMNLRLHSHEFLFPSQWISDCIPMSPYSQPMDSISDCIPMSSYSPCQILESFGWVPPMSCHPDSKRAHRSQKNCILARFWGYPYTYHMGTPKIDCRAF